MCSDDARRRQFPALRSPAAINAHGSAIHRGAIDRTRRDDALPVRLEVAGASQLTLVADFGEQFDIGDHLDWADARLIR